jgi:hypothetical protein
MNDDARQWLTPWYPVTDTEICAALERQLRVELSDRHALHGTSARLVARRADTDDALFALPDGRVAEVHLTWRSSTEDDPRWPATSVFASLDEWAEASMTPLHEELSRLRR